MPSRPARTVSRKEKSKEKDPTPLDQKTIALKAEAEQLKAKLQQARRFLQEAPGMKAEAQRKEQQELLNKYRKVARIEGPADFRLELVNGRAATKPRRLRHERTGAPVVTVLLLIACCVVFYYAMHVLRQG